MKNIHLIATDKPSKFTFRKDEEPKQETLEEAAESKYTQGVYVINGIDIYQASRECFIDGAKWQQKRMYSEEEMFAIIAEILQTPALKDGGWEDIFKWFDHFKKK